MLKATPVITWANPADIVYGTALGATQLNATTTVPGTFVYTPAAGTVLSAGAAQTLSVTFTPTDAANYTTATQAVAINVAQGDAGHHLGDAGRHRLRHRAERDPAERDDDRARHVRLHAGGGTVLLGRRGADAVGDLHADRRGELHHRDQGGRRSTSLKATPVITWPTPADIVYGTALERDPAERDDDGARHVRLHAGGRHGAAAGAAQTLSVTFTPTDAANYTTATQAVAINVAQGDAGHHLADAGRHRLRHRARARPS